MIEINNLTYKYKNGNSVLNNINLKINPSEFVAIIGKNGSGKSTFAKLISGIFPPSSGEILINQINTKDKKQLLTLRKNIGIVFQNPENQIIFNNVYDDIAFTLTNLKIPKEEQKSIIENSLSKVNMIDFINKDPYELSLGQKQRIAIASVLSLNPEIIVFDEPTTMIDSKGKLDIYTIIENLKKENKTILYITNSIDEILKADRILVFEKGEIKFDFKKTDILYYLPHLEKLDLGIPYVLKQLLTLKKNGINICLDNFSEEELTEKIIEVLNEKNN